VIVFPTGVSVMFEPAARTTAPVSVLKLDTPVALIAAQSALMSFAAAVKLLRIGADATAEPCAGIVVTIVEVVI